jgi:phage terminase Nu1 subunit (DNA packaging protein)
MFISILRVPPLLLHCGVAEPRQFFLRNKVTKGSGAMADEFSALFDDEPAEIWPETISGDDLADLLGVSTRTVRELARKGVVERANGKLAVYAAYDSIKRYCAHMREQAAGRSDSTTLTEERIRVAREQGDKLALQNAVTRREMLPAREVESAWAGILRDVRAAFLGLPSRIHQRLTHLTAHDVAEIGRQIRDTLTEVAR